MCCREWVPASKGETVGESRDVEERAATDVASTLGSSKADNDGGGYSAHYLMKSSSLSSSKCIYIQSKTGI